MMGRAVANDQSLTVVSWGGSYARACVKGYHERFTAETGIAIHLEDYNGGLAQIRAQVEVGNVYWDVVDLEIPDLVRGCDEGLLELIEIDSLAAGTDGTPAEEDFALGTVTDWRPGHNILLDHSTPTMRRISRGRNRPPWPTSSTWGNSRAAAGCAARRW